MTASPEHIYAELVCPGFSHITVITSLFQIYAMLFLSGWLVNRSKTKHKLPAEGFKPAYFCSAPFLSTRCQRSTHPLFVFHSSTVLRKGRLFIFLC